MGHFDNQSASAIIGSTPAIERLRQQIQRLAGFDSVRSPHVPTVLICGATGTGKGLVARTLHDSGPRADGPFVDVNCAAIPESMLEAELFGFEEGAFTDARKAKPGLFEAATAGTLFLDEIDSCSLTLQSKLLKAIEDKSIRRLGAVESKAVDIKLVAATQRNLPGLVAANQFRADLYHRLAVVVLELPDLRQRPDDILTLADHYLRRYAEAHGLAPKQVSADGERWLRNCEWPGNVRELSHLMERITLLVPEDHVTSAILDELHVPMVTPQAAQDVATSPPPASTVESAHDDPKQEIERALRNAGGNVAAAARALGIGRNALRYRMRRYDIERKTAEELAAAPPQTTPAAPAPARAEQPVEADPAASSQPSWEERTATVLSIELVMPSGDSAMTGSDPWTTATKWRDRIVERIRGFGGILVQSSPSRLTTVFGVPKALEKSAERAVQGALAILNQVAEESEHSRPVPQIRFAAHLGHVQFDGNAGNLADALLPRGDTMALPERLLGHAADREILVSSQLGRRIERSFGLAERTISIAGSSEEVRAFAVSALRPDTVKAAPFIGRQRELGLIVEAFERAKGGAGQVVFVVGDAGIGKSRLLGEFRASLRDEDHAWIEGRCATYGSNSAFLPLVDGIRRYLGIDDHDGEPAAIAKVDAHLAALGEDVAWTRPFLLALLSLGTRNEVAELDSASRRSETFRALQAMAMRDAERQPLVICIEDLHWIDHGSEEFIGLLAEALPTARILLICSYRPGYRHPFQDRSYYLRLGLSPLSADETADIAEATLGVDQLPDAVRALISSKAEGNPFFIEEISTSLLEDGSLRRTDEGMVLTRGIDEIVVPDTIQDVLIARIDRLAAESRQAIQIASVIGREFALRLLERILESGKELRGQIEELRSLELIYEKGMHPELAYMFKHALTHDVAYNSVHRNRRETLHRVIGVAIEELYSDRLPEHFETLAYHFEEGHDLRRALDYHARAAEKAAEGHANQSVVHHCRRALDIAEPMAESVPDSVVGAIEERLALALFYLSDFADSGSAYERAAARAADAKQRAMLLASAGLSYFWAHDYANAGRLLESAMHLARTNEDLSAQAVVHYLNGVYAGIIEADFDTFEKRCSLAMQLQKESGSEIAAAMSGFARTELYEWTGRYRQAIEAANQGIEVGKRLRLSHLIILPMWFGGKALSCLGDYGKAIDQLQNATDLCERIGDRAWSARLLNTLGWVFAEIGAVEIARQYNQRAAVIARDFGDPEIIANSEINLAWNQLTDGRIDEAGLLIEPIVADLERSTDPWMRWRFSLHVLDAQARIAVARGNLDAALDLAETQAEGARRHRAPKIQARAATLRGRILLDMERRTEARAAIAESAEIALAIHYRRSVLENLELESEVDRRDGNRSDADEKLARARALLSEAAATLSEGELRSRLLAQLP